MQMSRWWFQIFFIFTQKIGEDEPILIHFFSDGWFNHQPVPTRNVYQHQDITELGPQCRSQTYWVYETGRCGHSNKQLGTSQELATLSSETPCFWNSLFFLEIDFAALGQMIQFHWTPLIVPRSVNKEDLMISMVMSSYLPSCNYNLYQILQGIIHGTAHMVYLHR